MTGLEYTEEARPGKTGGEGLSWAGMRRVIEACDRFEELCRAGGRPEIESFLVDAEGPVRATLLRRLIALEVEERRVRGESPARGEYLARFPGESDLIPNPLPTGPDHVTSDTPAPLDDPKGGFGGTKGRTAGDPNAGPTGERSVFVSAVTVSKTVDMYDERTDGHPAGPPLPMPDRIGRYKVRRLLGEGGFGRVYHAWDGELDRYVAVKVPRAGAFVSAKHAEAFVREARLAAGMKHPSIVTVHDIGHDDDGSLFVVLEYIEGQSLSDLMRSESVSHRRLAELLAQVAEALDYAHSRGLVHRDLKPANLLVDVQGRPHVTDFGLAVHEEGVRSLGRQIAGTLHYMAPEQVRGESHRLDGRTDLWGLGVVLYQMLTGRLPFQGSERAHVFDEIVHHDPPTPRQVDPELPHELERICLKCLSKRMSDRYPTALELAADLWHWVSRGGHGAESGSARSQVGPGAYSVTTEDSVSGAPRHRAGVIPKGLRSFDGSDESFFLSLLPGPFDRDGLPESLRFWKTRVESVDPDEAFKVGLLYGPSGGGKSSLIKAGLIPRLAPHVRPLYIEATSDGTDARLLRALLKACPDLPEGSDLVEAMRAARESPSLRRGKKLLVVIDQFEQWLHAFRPGRGESLVEALRHCDGVAVQCLVMARDDFGTAAMRFMNAVEIPLVEGKNYALVDRFDLPHAARVLALFGRALGRLPEEGPPSAEQGRFLDASVAGMAEQGKVAPIRLALFAEMFRARTWDKASLRRVGGAEGVGVLFLEESLGPAVSSPRRRAHQEAARSVLAALLPAPGVYIKGHMKPYAELLAVSGYSERPEAFDDLIRVLDGDLRLITPCDPERGNSDSALASFGLAPAASVVPAAERSFQLTHDDLVPTLRKWLSRRQSETAAGRAELLLEDRAAVWAARPDPRYLPSLPECVWIGLMTRPAGWTEAQTRMMLAAARRYAVRALVAAAVAALIAAAGLRVAGWLDTGRGNPEAEVPGIDGPATQAKGGASSRSLRKEHGSTLLFAAGSEISPGDHGYRVIGTR